MIDKRRGLGILAAATVAFATLAANASAQIDHSGPRHGARSFSRSRRATEGAPAAKNLPPSTAGVLLAASVHRDPSPAYCLLPTVSCLLSPTYSLLP